MAESLQIDAQSVARRCSCDSPDYTQLTSIDWIVLDFTDGTRSLSDIQSIAPVRRDELVAAYQHLHQLGMISIGAKDENSSIEKNSGNAQEKQRTSGLSGLSSLRDSKLKVSLSMPTSSMWSDDVCAQYLPARLFSEFRRFQPTLIDEKLDMSIETQAFAEFIHENLASLSHYDLLGLTEGQCNKAAVKQAYLLRTKQFHPDRYFRKNIGPFAPRIAAIFKAVTSAFAALQRTV